MSIGPGSACEVVLPCRSSVATNTSLHIQSPKAMAWRSRRPATNTSFLAIPYAEDNHANQGSGYVCYRGHVIQSYQDIPQRLQHWNRNSLANRCKQVARFNHQPRKDDQLLIGSRWATLVWDRPNA